MIVTERLVLRPWTSTDADVMIAMNRDPDVMRWLGDPLEPHESIRILERFQAHYDRHGFCPWCVEYRSEPIGWIGLWYPLFRPEPEIGWRLVRSAWGYGLATEGARGALDDIFGRVGVDDIISFTTERNRRSRAVMDRLGMVRDLEGDFLHPSLPPDHRLAPHVLYRLTRERYATAAASTGGD